MKHSIPFVLDHAIYMCRKASLLGKAIHGSKTMNDKIDSRKIALLLRSGMIPMAYVYPQAMRAIRDLLRRRMHFMRKRSKLLTHIQNTRNQYNLPSFEKNISRKSNRINVIDHFDDPAVQKSMELNMSLIHQYDGILRKTENYILNHVKTHNVNEFYLLRTIPGVGKILALVMLYEIHDINRFEKVQNFTSHARLIKPQKESAGKLKGSCNGKMGNAFFKWAFSEATILLIREKQDIKNYHGLLKNKYGKSRALAIISHKLGRAVNYMLKNKQAFNMIHFLKIKDRAA